MNRRNFIRGAAGLAALAVAGPTLAALSETDRDRLEQMLKNGGAIYGQTFHLTDSRPITLSGLHNVSFIGCTFVWDRPVDGSLLELDNCFNINVSHCHFNAPGSKGGIHINGARIN